MSETKKLLRESRHTTIEEALKELISLQLLSNSRAAVIKIEGPDRLSPGLEFEVHGSRFVVLRFSRVIDANRAQQISEETGLPVIMIHDLEGIDVSLARLEPIKKEKTESRSNE